MSKTSRMKAEPTATDGNFKAAREALEIAEKALATCIEHRNEIAQKIQDEEVVRAELVLKREAAIRANDLALAGRLGAEIREAAGRIEDLSEMAAAAADVIREAEIEVYEAEGHAETVLRGAWLSVSNAALHQLKKHFVTTAVVAYRAALMLEATEKPFEQWARDQVGSEALAGYFPADGVYAAVIGIDLPERPPECRHLSDERRREIRLDGSRIGGAV